MTEISTGMNKTWLFIIGGVGIACLVTVAWLFYPQSVVAPEESSSALDIPIVATSTTTAASATPVAVAPSSSGHPLKIVKGDVISSWDFTGVYTDNAELTAKAYAEISRLTNLLGVGTYPDVNLYVSLANQYQLLGNGKQEYYYLGLAIAADPASGLPWHNLGVLMDRLGAKKTAQVAYDKAVSLQPQYKDIQ